MKAENILDMIKRYTDQYGVDISWNKTETVNNSRGVSIENKTDEIKSAKVLLLKEKFNPLQIIGANPIGLSHDYARYVIALPEIDIKKDMIITDNHNMKWKLGVIDWFDIGGTAVCKQSALTEVK